LKNPPKSPFAKGGFPVKTKTGVGEKINDKMQTVYCSSQMKTDLKRSTFGKSTYLSSPFIDLTSPLPSTFMERVRMRLKQKGEAFGFTLRMSTTNFLLILSFLFLLQSLYPSSYLSQLPLQSRCVKRLRLCLLSCHVCIGYSGSF